MSNYNPYNCTVSFSDFSPEVRAALAWWLERWRTFSRLALPPLPSQKTFHPKHVLPVLEDYRKAAPTSFWEFFPSCKLEAGRSLINAKMLYDMALECGFRDLVTLNKVYTDLHEGADTGCRGIFRLPGKATNAPSAYNHGPQVTDAIADWCYKGFARGPVPDSEVPANAKFSGIMSRAKPSGSVRVILNLSAPKGRSVNDGINANDFPAVMSSTSRWLDALWSAGFGCWIMKCDWSDAYKHICVRPQDTHLQWFKWLGMNFVELALIFGCSSSAGIFDRVAKIVLFIAQRRSGLAPGQICQHLDDVVACAPANSTSLQAFDAEFTWVAEQLGVHLAPRTDPDKSFAPCKSGVIFGVHYDTEKWVWAVPHEKLCRLLHSLQHALSSDFLTQEEIWSLAGKIIHVKALVPNGKFNIYFLLLAQGHSKDPKSLVPISANLKRQLSFWLSMLRVCSGEASIPRAYDLLPPWSIEVFTDAAGGSPDGSGRGAGAVSAGWWVYLPWSQAINQGRPTGDGRRLDRVLSALELIGPLAALCAGARHCRGMPVRFWVDNAGSCFIFQKGYSTSCPLATSLVSALADVAAGLGCRVAVEKITRCSSAMASMSDALSKADFARFWGIANRFGGFGLPSVSLPVPPALLAWVRQPKEDFDLGRRLLLDIAEHGPVLGL